MLPRFLQRQNAKSCQNEFINLIDVLAQRWTVMCLIMLTVNCQAICETCSAVVRPHPTINSPALQAAANDIKLCVLQRCAPPAEHQEEITANPVHLLPSASALVLLNLGHICLLLSVTSVTPTWNSDFFSSVLLWLFLIC